MDHPDSRITHPRVYPPLESLPDNADWQLTFEMPGNGEPFAMPLQQAKAFFLVYWPIERANDSEYPLPITLSCRYRQFARIEEKYSEKTFVPDGTSMPMDSSFWVIPWQISDFIQRMNKDALQLMDGE